MSQLTRYTHTHNWVIHCNLNSLNLRNLISGVGSLCVEAPTYDSHSACQPACLRARMKVARMSVPACPNIYIYIYIYREREIFGSSRMLCLRMWCLRESNASCSAIVRADSGEGDFPTPCKHRAGAETSESPNPREERSLVDQ